MTSFWAGVLVGILFSIAFVCVFLWALGKESELEAKRFMTRSIAENLKRSGHD